MSSKHLKQDTYKAAHSKEPSAQGKSKKIKTSTSKHDGEPKANKLPAIKQILNEANMYQQE